MSDRSQNNTGSQGGSSSNQNTGMGNQGGSSQQGDQSSDR
jgi:hypothetical protein